MFTSFKLEKKFIRKLSILVFSVFFLSVSAVFISSPSQDEGCSSQNLQPVTPVEQEQTNPPVLEEKLPSVSPSATPAPTVSPEPTEPPAVKKTVCLTFDDGPSTVTPDVLETLKAYNVPATFFVVSSEDNLDNLHTVTDILAQGHCVGLHSNTHDYKAIYQNTDAFWEDIENSKITLAPYLGDYEPKCLRFPGGSTNTVSHKYGGSGLMSELKTQATEKGYRYFDWNSSAGDATSAKPSSEVIASNILKDAKDKDNVVVLMHDSKRNQNTADALPVVIEWFLENGYTFEIVDNLDVQI